MTCISPVSTILSAGFLGLGAMHLLTPMLTCKFFGLPCSSCRFPGAAASTKETPQEVSADPGAVPFIYANGGRELMLSIAFAMLGFQGNREGIRALMVGISVAAQIDAYVVWKYGGEKYGGWNGRWMMHSLGGAVVGIVAWTGWCM